MHVAADCAPQVGTGSAWQRWARFCAVAYLAGGALTSCGGKAEESVRAPSSEEGTPTSAAAPQPPEASGGEIPRLEVPRLELPTEETCNENPLLAYCPTLAPAPARPVAQPPAPMLPDLRSVGEVEAVLSDSCGRCHGGEPSPARCGTCDGMYYVENLRRLVQSGSIVPCRWQDSPLFQRIADGSMPPPDSSPSYAITPEELEFVGDFVDGLCGKLTGGGPEDTQRANIERWLGTDCGSCHGPALDATGDFAPSALDGMGDIAELISAGLIVPCDADGSALVRVLRDESMPPPGFSGPRPGRAELTALIAFINRPCSRR